MVYNNIILANIYVCQNSSSSDYIQWEFKDVRWVFLL